MNKRIRSDRKTIAAISLGLIVLLVLALWISGVFSRYRTKLLISNEVQYSNQLAERFTLQDHAAQQQKDGSWLLTDEMSAGNTYALIPGTQPPANPVITIEGKTEIPAYLYLELVASPNAPEYTLDPDVWVLLEGVTGKNGGLVYAYRDGPLVDDEEDEENVIVIQHFLTLETLDKYPVQTGGNLSFYAYLIQQTDESGSLESAKTAFVEVVH